VEGEGKGRKEGGRKERRKLSEVIGRRAARNEDQKQPWKRGNYA
jgi:hypothetical protein